MPLDAQTGGFLQQLAAAGAKPFYDLEPAEARVALDALLGMMPPTVTKVASVMDRPIPGPAGPIPARFYTPLGKGPFPVLVYFHGGGFVLGSLDGFDSMCRELAGSGNTIVVSVAYRLGPEAPFPAASDDAYAATKWVSEHAAEFNGDAKRLSVGGDSAGGNLAAVTSQQARDRKGPKIRTQLLIYPVTDAAGAPRPSMIQNADGPLLTRKDMEWFFKHYLKGADDAKSAVMSPLLAKSLADLPPALVITCEFDPLRDEGEEYAAKMQQAGVAVTQHRYDGAIHGHLCFFTALDVGRAMMDECTRWLREQNRV